MRMLITEYEIYTDELRARMPQWFPLGQVRCPKCKGVMSISPKVHKILDNGDLMPSLVCRLGNCNFHAFVTLENYPHNSIDELHKQEARE